LYFLSALQKPNAVKAKTALSTFVNFFLNNTLHDFAVNEEIAEATRKLFTEYVISLLLKSLTINDGPANSLKEDKGLLNAVIKLIIISTTKEKMKRDSLLNRFLLKGQTKEELSSEIKKLVVFLLPNAETILNKVITDIIGDAEVSSCLKDLVKKFVYVIHTVFHDKKG